MKKTDKSWTLKKKHQKVDIHTEDLFAFTYTMYYNSLFLFALFSVTTRGVGTVLAWYNSWLYRVWLITRVSSLFYILLGFSLYVTFGKLNMQ